MPVLKPISGHSKSVKAAIDYLTRKERALASDYVNCEEVDRRGNPVWRQMDDTRRALGCDVPVGQHRKVRTYEHFVLSPDPRDEVDLATLRDLATTWAREYFGNYQVVIYYHDDNELKIPHAHLIVNNANLERQGRVSTILTPAFEARMYRGLQRMAAERGLHAFTERATSVNNAEWAKAERERAMSATPTREGPRATAQRTYRNKQDRELEAKGISWKRDVRDRMACALRMSSTEEEFVEACRVLGLGVRESASRRAKGEYVYRHPGGDAWEVTGSTLGRDWSRWGIQRRLARDRQRGVEKPAGTSRERLLSALSPLRAADGSMAMQVLGTTHDVDVTAASVVDMLDACARADVRSMADFSEALREPMPPSERDRLRAAMGLARALGHLPQERDRVDGARVAKRMRGGRAVEVTGPAGDGPMATTAREAGAEVTRERPQRVDEPVGR